MDINEGYHEYHGDELALKEMQDCLDSDDELPTSYTEKPDSPAYLDDNRFDEIGDLVDFPWIHTLPIIHSETQDLEDSDEGSIETASDIHEEQTHTTLLHTTDKGTLQIKSLLREWGNNILLKHTTNLMTTQGRHAQDKYARTLLRSGILKKRDIICMKSFAAQTTDESALLWFNNFLQKKDLQAEYRFLKSCLVPSQIIGDNYCGQIFAQNISNHSNVKFELVVI